MKKQSKHINENRQNKNFDAEKSLAISARELRDVLDGKKKALTLAEVFKDI